MRQQGRILALVFYGFLIGCNNGNDKEVATGDTSKQPLNSQKQEKLLPLATNSPATTIAVEEWTSDPSLQWQLGEEKTDSAFCYRLPTSFTWGGMSGNNRMNVTIWKSEPRADKSVAKLTVLTSRKYAELKSMTLEQAAADMFKVTSQQYKNFFPGKTSLGTINGIPFYKASFTMDDPETSLHGRALVYHGHLGNHYIHLVLSDVEPHLAETEKLLEAAALSVRPKP